MTNKEKKYLIDVVIILLFILKIFFIFGNFSIFMTNWFINFTIGLMDYKRKEYDN